MLVQDGICRKKKQRFERSLGWVRNTAETIHAEITSISGDELEECIKAAKLYRQLYNSDVRETTFKEWFGEGTAHKNIKELEAHIRKQKQRIKSLRKRLNPLDALCKEESEDYSPKQVK